MLVVDAANVVGSRPDGWWRDRPGAARSLVERVRAAVADDAVLAPVVVVLEGRARAGVAAGLGSGVEVVHAGGEGDAEIVATVDRLAGTSASAPTANGGPADGSVVVVTADRALADDVRARGGSVVGPSWLLARLPE